MKNLMPFLNNYVFVVFGNLNKVDLLTLVEFFPGSTIKKTIIKNWLKISVQLYLFRLFPTLVQKDLYNLFKYFRKQKGTYFVFSQNIKQRNRLYVIRKSITSKISFIKVVWGNEKANIKNETEAFKILKNFKFFKYITPCKISKFNQFEIIEYAIMPSDSVLLKKKDFSIYYDLIKINTKLNLQELKTLDEIKKLTWWQNFFHSKENPLFKDYLLKKLSNYSDIKLIWCHGDLGSENVFKHNDKYILIDWEKSCFDAPIITDYMGIILGNFSDEILLEKEFYKTDCTLYEFYRKHFEYKFSFEEFLLGIVFYLGTNFNLAFYLISKFNYENTVR